MYVYGFYLVKVVKATSLAKQDFLELGAVGWVFIVT